MSVDGYAVSTQQRATQMAIISPGIAFIDRNHHETTFGCVDIFRWTKFNLIAVGRQRVRDEKARKERKKDKRFINQLKLQATQNFFHLTPQ